ncbi:IclR family transcriptional regulator [Sulfitobacter sp. 1A12126]
MQVRQVENVLDLLEFFAERGRPASLAEVSEHFTWPRSSTYNLLSTLSSRGYLYEPIGRGRFYPTPRWLMISQRVSGAEPVPEDLLKLGLILRDETQETVCIGAAAGQSLVFLDVAPSPARIRYAAETGQRVPIHATASGHAVMSQWSASQRASLLRKVEFERYGVGSPMSIDAVEDRIRSGLHRGWFKSASSYSVDLGGVSVPMNLSDRTYSVTVAGPLNRVEAIMPELAVRVHTTVKRHFGADYFTRFVPNLASPPIELDTQP